MSGRTAREMRKAASRKNAEIASASADKLDGEVSGATVQETCNGGAAGPVAEDLMTEPPFVLPYLAYFFIPLPESLGLPDGWVLPISEPSPAQWWRSKGLVGDGDGDVPPSAHMAGSLKIHRALAPGNERDWPSVLFDVASAALPNDAQQVPPTGVTPDRPPMDLTVVEMAVGYNGTPEDDEGNVDTDTSLPDAVSDAFDRGLAWAREVQRAFYVTRRTPGRLVSRESLPFAVPFASRRIFDDDGEQLPFRAPLSLFLLNSNLPGPGEDLSEAEETTLRHALGEQVGKGVFTSYLDFQREGAVALYRDGAYGASVLFTATACEVLLDDLLAHMLWQEGRRPERPQVFLKSSS